MIAKLAATAAVTALLAAFPAVASPASLGIVGISPQSAPTASDFDLMARAGVTSVRLPLLWSQVEPVSPYLKRPDWTSFDRDFALAVRHELNVLPFVWGTPSWLAAHSRTEPVRGVARRAWASFLRRTVLRYRPGGAFWREHPDLEFRPIRAWEIWNEPNIVTFGGADPARFAELIRISGRVVKRAHPGARVIVGGLFGRPLQVPPNVHIGAFLSSIYRERRVKQWFDGVALHPYVAGAAAMRGQIHNLRRVMRVHNDAATPLYVTELGWGSDSFESRWERGPHGQARELDLAFSMLAANSRSWRIGGVWWFTWTDADGPSCQFCDSAGLLTRNREAKPAWFRFNAWTGGDADTIPRASFDPLSPAAVSD